MDSIKQQRYTISAIANALIGIFFLIIAYKTMTLERTLTFLGSSLIAIAFLVKAIADYLYGTGKFNRKNFHKYTSIHYALFGITLLICKCFGTIVSIVFAMISLFLAYTEYQHQSKLEDNLRKFIRHSTATFFRYLLGLFIFFDAFFYFVAVKSIFALLFTIVFMLAGIYIMYSALTTYEYAKETTGYNLKKIYYSILQ